MKALIFAKKKQTKESKPFNTYLARLTKTNGEEIVVEAKFREECGNPKADKCPMFIEFEKADANLSEKKEKYIDEVGEEKEVTRRKLWISKYSESAEKYVDHSLDEF